MEEPTPTKQIKWLVVLLDHTRTELTKETLRFGSMDEESGARTEVRTEAIKIAKKTAKSARLAYRYAKDLDKYNLLFDSTQRTSTAPETLVGGDKGSSNEHEYSDSEDDETDGIKGTDDTIPADAAAATFTNIFDKLTLPLKLVIWDEAKLPAVCEHYTPDPVGHLYQQLVTGRRHPIPTRLPAFLCMPECGPLLCGNQSTCVAIATYLHKREVDRVKAYGCGTDYCVYDEYYSNVTEFNKAGRKFQHHINMLCLGISETEMNVPLKIRLAFFKHGDQRIDVRTVLYGGTTDLMKEDDLSWVKRALKRHWINGHVNGVPSSSAN